MIRKRKQYKFLFLPIEKKVRELDAKVLLALEAVKRGYAVIIGSKSMKFIVNSFPEGVYLYKDSSAPMRDFFKKLHHNNHYVVVHDEEGFILLNDDRYINSRLKFDTIKEVDLFLCWGEYQSSLVSKIVENLSAKTKVRITGHPRIDLLRNPICNYETPIKRKPTILINTKLAEYNHVEGLHTWMNMLDLHDMIHNDDERKLFREQMNYKETLFNQYKILIEKLSFSYPQYDIILRPHPSENSNIWKDFVSNFSNVRVEISKSVGFWIKQADIIIHTGCTTAIEALILGKPSISFKPIKEERFDPFLPDSVSIMTENSEELINTINQIFKGEYNLEEYFKNGFRILLPYLHNFQGQFSFIQIMDEIEKQSFNTHSLSKIPYLLIYLMKIQEITLSFKTFLYSSPKNSKTIEISTDEMNELIKNLINYVCVDLDVNLKKLRSDVYLIYSNNIYL